MQPDDEDLWPIFNRRPLGGDRREQRAHQQLKDAQRHGHQPSRRGRSLSRDEIVKAAIKVADAEGSQAISMRRIAREVGAGAMSLYWHVSSKDELLDLMLDAVESEQKSPAMTGDWRADLSGFARSQRTVLHRHQWLMDFIGGRPPFGPNTLRNLEQALAATDRLGLDTATALNVLSTLSTYVMGAVLREFREIGVERRDQEAIADVGEQELRDLLGSHMQRVRATGRFPHFVRIWEAGIDPDSPKTRDARFEFGLQCVLDGIATHITDPAPAPARPAPAEDAARASRADPAEE